MKRTVYYFYYVISHSENIVKYDKTFYTCLSYKEALSCLINDLSIYILQGCTIKILGSKLLCKEVI